MNIKRREEIDGWIELIMYVQEGEGHGRQFTIVEMLRPRLHRNCALMASMVHGWVKERGWCT